jgi:tetratricopeptide (TPR) repeat protein
MGPRRRLGGSGESMMNVASRSECARAAHHDGLVVGASSSPPPSRDQLEDLLERAAQAVRSDPGQGRQLADAARALGAQLGAPDLIARACYIAARAHAMNAEHETAIQLIGEAQAGYEAAGMPMEMLRTNAGLMNILRDLGRYEEALAVGQETLSGIARYGLGEEHDAAVLIALVHQNTGLCYEQMGRYEQALESHALAEQRFRALGMVEALGEIGNNRGIVLLALGRSTTALQIFTQSARLFADAGLTLPYATTLINLGTAHLLLGQFTQSLTVFEDARRLFANLDAQADAHVLLLDTGDAYMALNRYPEALTAYQTAAERLRDARMPFDRARALWGAGTALLAQHQLIAAASALDEAAELFHSAGNVALLSGVLLERAALQAQQQNLGAARATAARALALVAPHDLPVQQLYAHLRLADLHAEDVASAEQHLIAAQRAGERVALPHTAFRLSQRMGNLRLRQRRIGESRALLTSAVEQLELLRGTVATEALRISFFQDKVALYEDLLRLQLDHAPDESPWDILVTAERARARALADRLVEIGGHAAAAGDPSEHAQLQADLHAVYTELLSGSAPQAPGRQGALRERAAELEQAITQAHLRGDSGGPAALAEPPTEPALRQRISGQGGVLAYYIVGDDILAFVAVGGELRIVRRVSQVALVEALLTRLASQWERLTSAPAFVERHLSQLERSTRLVLRELYQALISPVASLIEEIAGSPRRLMIAPHGLLHQVPFHALFDGERYLVDDYEVAYTPSIMALSPVATAPAPSNRAVVVGVEDQQIPLVAAEVGAIGRYLPGAKLLIGAEATLSAVGEQAPGCAVLHLACHGIFRSDNPMFSSLQLSDGWLTAIEITRMDLRGALVALSACESGRGRVYDGDEVLGLARAFLVAGARALLGSLWIVQDASTAALMERWYATMARGLEPAAALREAQIALREQFSHPFYWAPFYVVSRT